MKHLVSCLYIHFTEGTLINRIYRVADFTCQKHVTDIIKLIVSLKGLGIAGLKINLL